MALATSCAFLLLYYCRYFDKTFTAMLLVFFIVGNSQVSVYRTIGPTLVSCMELFIFEQQVLFGVDSLSLLTFNLRVPWGGARGQN